jgi:ubiquinone/menaquinone biosynthesis C-methylase UbiE
MKKAVSEFYVSPITYGPMKLEIRVLKGEEIISGNYIDEMGNGFAISEGIPDFTLLNDKGKNEYAISLFNERAAEYDKYQHLSFETFYQDENTVRNSLIDRLELGKNFKVLEVNAGTGRDSVLIASRLSKNGLLHVQDISSGMLKYCKEKLENIIVPYEIHKGNACRLPYKDKVFDAVYSFGGVGMNTYANNKEALKEMVRVTKTGGRIVFGGLSLGPWLRNTFFGKVLINHNIHYANEITLTDFPIEARNINLSWILNGAGFVVDFTVEEGEPKANFEYEIPGPRGGTHLTRYLGQLEGVTQETKELAIKARAKLGISMHKWLDELIRKEALKIIKD